MDTFAVDQWKFGAFRLDRVAQKGKWHGSFISGSG